MRVAQVKVSSKMKSLILVCFFLISIALTGFSQSLSPFTLNMGGGFSSSLEWSIGESVSVANFVQSNYQLNTGVLQPQANLITALSDFSTSQFSTQIRLGPNPVLSVVNMDVDLIESGSLSFDLYDLAGIKIMHQEAGVVFGNYSTKILMENYLRGTYIIRLLFKPINSEPQTAFFKLVKL